MKTCPNCKTTEIPDDAKFCPMCGTCLSLVDRKISVSKCELSPGIVRKGEQCKLVWNGKNVKYVEVDNKRHRAEENIVLTPSQGHTYNINFIGEDGTCVVAQVSAEVLEPFLYDGKGAASNHKGFLCVDIRQCKCVNERGWTGKYEFEPGLPQGFTGFYAMFDKSEGIQIEVDKGKVDSIYINEVDPTNQDDYTMKVWRGKKNETSQRVIYFAIYKNNNVISKKQDRDRSKIILKSEMQKLTNTYDKEFQDFFGMSFEKLMEQAVDFTQKREDPIKAVIKQPNPVPKQESESDIIATIIRYVIKFILLSLCIMALLYLLVWLF